MKEKISFDTKNALLQLFVYLKKILFYLNNRCLYFFNIISRCVYICLQCLISILKFFFPKRSCSMSTIIHADGGYIALTGFNSDGQQFHQYQQIEQIPLIRNH